MISFARVIFRFQRKKTDEKQFGGLQPQFLPIIRLNVMITICQKNTSILPNTNFFWILTFNLITEDHPKQGRNQVFQKAIRKQFLGQYQPKPALVSSSVLLLLRRIQFRDEKRVSKMVFSQAWENQSELKHAKNCSTVNSRFKKLRFSFLKLRVV